MKKIVVFILTALLIAGILPFTALADGAYSVTYNANGAETGTVPVDSATYNAGDLVTVSANSGLLAKTGYTFAGWNTAFDGTGTAYAENAVMTMGEASVTLFAQWAAVPCTVKFDSQGGTPVADWTGSYGGIILNAPVTAFEGFDFFGWYTDTTFTTLAAFPYTVTGSTTLYAKFQPKSAYLSNVTVSAGTLSKAFSKTAYSYKLQLAETESTVTITPVLENTNAKVQIWTNRDHSIVTTPGITVNVENNKTITVKIKVTYAQATAGTEAENEDLVHVYTFVIKRDKSTDATLKSLTVSAGALSPAFDPAVTAYTVNLDSSVKSVTIYADANSPLAKVKHSVNVKLNEGQTKTITIKVKPQSGPAKIYTITITRAKSSGTPDTTVTPGNGGGNNGGDKDDKGKGHNK